MAVKSPWAPPPIHSRDVRAEYERLRAENVSVARGSCVGQLRRAPHRTATSACGVQMSELIGTGMKLEGVPPRAPRR
jgi:hypothetical protein